MSLKEICTDLHQSVEGGQGAAHHRLSRGLHIVYEAQDGWRRLAIGRKETAPSADEWRIVSQHFDLPTGQNPLTAWRDQYMVLELTWREIQQPSLFDIESRGQHEQEVG